MKIHRTIKIKIFSALTLIICAGLYWYINPDKEIPFHYIWPMHLVVMGLGFIMVFGMMSDQKIIDSEIQDRLGKDGIINNLRNRIISSICTAPVLLITLLPAFSIMGNAIEEAFDTNGLIAFVSGWLLFSIASFMYFVIAQPLLNYSYKKIANKALQDDR